MSKSPSNKFYITTAIPYVNAVPHIGHALEFVQADVIARYRRNIGNNVNFQIGVDEHGIKLYQTAVEADEDPKSFADKNADIFMRLSDTLNLSIDSFVRTTDEGHKKGAQALWRACSADIYKDSYEGLYCIGCEEYKVEAELVDGRCVEHPNKKIEKLKEENYFFKLSKYSKTIAQKISSDELKIYPAGRKNEILSLIKSGLRDVPISRLKEKLPWGIDVPDDPDHVMYVWFDALPNYITGVGYGDPKRKKDLDQWWPADLHVIGKGILRFHAALWPGMLLSAGLPLPRAILVHGYINIEGQKISKSLGNSVDPIAIAEKYGAEALRYYLMREIPVTEDGDFSIKRFVERYNYDLANDLGNLVQRVSAMTEKYLSGNLPALKIKPVKKAAAKERLLDAGKKIKDLEKLMLEYKLNEYLDEVWQMVARANKHIEETKPWEVAKRSPEKIEALLSDYISRILDIAWFIEPFLPDTAKTIETIFSGTKLKPTSALFPKIEDAL